jgi:hypothetical protein
MTTVRRVLLAFALATMLACEAMAPAKPGGSPSVPPSMIKVAFVKDLSVPDADEHALPAFQAAKLAFETAAARDPAGVTVELEEFDLAEEATEFAAIGADPGYVAMIVAPGVNGVDGLAEELPVVSLSDLGEPGAGDAWTRLVAPMPVVADTLASGLRQDVACVLSEDPAPDPLSELLAERLTGAPVAAIDPAGAATVARNAGCDVVIWAGGPDAGAEAAEVLRPAGVAMIGGDRLLDPDFLASAGTAAEGTFALCSCVSVASSTELAVRRFVQDYQSEHGTAPGPYAVEAWDAAHLVLRALHEGGATRAQVREWMGARTTLDGLVRTYRLDPRGELIDPASMLRLFRVDGGRWLHTGWNALRDRLAAADAG